MTTGCRYVRPAGTPTLVGVAGAILASLTAHGQVPGGFTDPQIVPGVTLIKALHLMELRSGAVSDIQNLPPQASGTLRAEILKVGGAAEDVDASEHFSDPNGDALTYTATSSNIDVVTTTISNETMIGLGTGRAEVVEGAGAYVGRSLRLKYPAGTYGSRNQAIQSRIDLPRSYDELYVSYRVRFDEAFDFVRGGKLPGLIGGAGNTGGNRPDGTDGWSGRMMWRRGGEAVQYVYHPDQPDIYGEDFRWNRRFEPGRWHTVEHHYC